MKSSAALETTDENNERLPDFAARVKRYAGQAIREAVAEHHRAGDPVSIWRDGRIVLLHPDGSVTEPEPRDS